MVRSIRYNIIPFLILIGILASCKVKQPQILDHPEQYFTVSFYSPGDGIDHEAENMLLNTIDKYTKQGHSIGFTVVHWGKEGERDYCFALQKLMPEVYNTFLKEINTQLSGRKAHINEQKACKIED